MPAPDLISYIFGTERDVLSERFAAWLRGSKRFDAFSAEHRDKIRKKVRGTRDTDQRIDLLCELETAFLLLGERQFAVEYEAFNAAKTRGPDFTVRFRANTRCNVEVAHLHAAITPPDATESVERAANAKLCNAICAKLGQAQPGMPNVLLVWAAPALFPAIDGAEAIRSLFERATVRDDPYFARRGFADARAWHSPMLRLSGVLARPLLPPTSAEAVPVFWPNPQARQPLAPELRNALLRSVR